MSLWGIVLMQESLATKASSGTAQTTASEIIQYFIQTGHIDLFLLAQTENDVWPPFLVHQSLQTSSTVW